MAHSWGLYFGVEAWAEDLEEVVLVEVVAAAVLEALVVEVLEAGEREEDGKKGDSIDMEFMYIANV